MTPPTRVPIALSTSSVYPESTASCFATAAELGYDGIEVMVGTDVTSTDTAALQRLVDKHGIGVTAIHSPCLLLTQHVWGSDPWEKLRRSGDMAKALGADTVVVHPPFRWQREYARGFIDGIADLEARTGLVFGVENMYPWRATGKRELKAYVPDWDVTKYDFAHFTLDLSHSSTARMDCLELATRMGDRLRHVHLTDGTGSARDEHLVPGTGDQRAVELLQHLAGRGFDGHLVVEIATRRRNDHEERLEDLRASLEFSRACFVPTVH